MNNKIPKPPKPFRCSICQEWIEGEYGNSAEPINDGTCCNYCNSTEVMLARIREDK